MEKQKKVLSEEKESNKPQIFMMSNIKLVMWKNTTGVGDDKKVFYNYTIEKVYKRKDSDEWESTMNFNLRDLEIVQRLINEYLSFRTPLKAN